MQLQSIRATDADGGSDGRIRYSIRSGNQNDVFHIDLDNGTVTIVKPLDYEKVTRHVLEIVAMDTPVRGNSKEAVHMLTVNLCNRNDNDPLFASATYSFTVVDDYPKGVIVGVIKATDLDDPADCVTYGWNSTTGKEGYRQVL